ncbi:hypothetical protein HYPSUDRAFT_102826, partial [Hypholoma sublateritium FD-334 SS-4]
MPYRTISRDLKLAAVRLYEREILPLDDILDIMAFSRRTFFRILRLWRTGVSYKKLKRIASERKEEARNAYIAHIAQYEPEEIGFLDETSKNEKTAARGYGRSKKGRRAVMRQRFVRGTRLSATALLTVDGILASTVVEGSMNREMYLDFLEHRVMPITSPYPGPLSVLIMDNARIHHGDEILEL